MRRAHDEPDAFTWQGPAAPGTTLHLRDIAGNISVRASADSLVHVTASKHWRHGGASAVGFAVARHGAELDVCALFGGGTCAATGYRRHNSGFHRILGIAWGSDMRADFVVTVPPGVAVDASTVSGDVAVDGAQAPLTLRTTNGNVFAATHVGPIGATTINGSIAAFEDSLPPGAGSTSATTVNGDVMVAAPANLGATLDLSTINGSVTTDFPVPVQGTHGTRRAQGTVGTGGAPVILHAVNGSVTLRKR
jgi:hypothetical protein